TVSGAAGARDDRDPGDATARCPGAAARDRDRCGHVGASTWQDGLTGRADQIHARWLLRDGEPLVPHDDRPKAALSAAIWRDADPHAPVSAAGDRRRERDPTRVRRGGP